MSASSQVLCLTLAAREVPCLEAIASAFGRPVVWMPPGSSRWRRLPSAMRGVRLRRGSLRYAMHYCAAACDLLNRAASAWLRTQVEAPRLILTASTYIDLTADVACPVVCVTDLAPSEVHWPWLRRFLRRPFFERWMQMVRRNMKRYDLTIFQTEWARRAAVASGLARERTWVLGSWPPVLSDQEPDTHSDRYAARRVLFVGGSAPYKGGHVLLEAFGLLQDRGVSAELHIAGGWRGRVPNSGVHVHGFLPPADLGRLMEECSVLVQPSLFDLSPRAVSDAQSFGLPVIASRVCGIPEDVDEGTTGLLVEPGEPEELAEALESLLANPER
ncbi:MAG: glycosyltransferase family 4 protein, partial [Armatimonadota bacterium]